MFDVEAAPLDPTLDLHRVTPDRSRVGRHPGSEARQGV